MTEPLTIRRKVYLQKDGRRRTLRRGPRRGAQAQGRVPRVARLVALAVQLEQLVQDNVISDYAELARLGRVSRARITQIMNLRLLAPEIQEAILFLPPTMFGLDAISERDLRPIAARANWQKQRHLWADLVRGRRITLAPNKNESLSDSVGRLARSRGSK